MKTTIVILVVILSLAPAAHSQVAVIVNKSVPVSSLTQAELLDIWLCNTRTWGNGQSIELLCLKDEGPEEKKFFDFLLRTPQEMRKAWLRAQLSGQARPPAMVSSQEELLKKVQSTPGAIGFVSSERVQGSVKVVLIID
jgi:ABC-type phosphate transport system substrate-binding protein